VLKRFVIWRQNSKESTIDLRTGTAWISAQEHDRIVRLVAVDHHRRRILSRLFRAAGENAVHRVIVGRADRIEFVIVAAGTRD